jgi:hypothetical protein
VIYVEHQEPTNPKQRQNWLPAPAEDFRPALRVYQPREGVSDGSWLPPSIKRLD